MDPLLRIRRFAPDLAATLELSEAIELERALEQGDDHVRRALAHWAAVTRQVSRDLARDLPAADLLALYVLGEDDLVLSADEEARLEAARGAVEAAIARHPGIEAAVDRIRADRDLFESMWEEERAHAPRPAARQDRARATPPAADRGPSPGVPRDRRARWIWRGAAVLAVAIFAVTVVLVVQRDAAFETIRTALHETTSITLPDGSVVHLAPETTLDYRIEGVAERRVRLAGEAVFEVMPEERGFVVETPAALTTVVGTIFSVRAEANATEVVLAEGVVVLANRIDPDQAITLEPGQRSTVRGTRPPEVPVPVDVAGSLAWTGTWYFQATPLGEIARRLGQHYNVDIRVPAELRDERVTGAFEQDVPVEQTLQTLAAALGIEVVQDADGGFRFTADD